MTIINDNIHDENILKRNRNKIGKHCCKWKPRIIRDKYKWRFNAIVRFFPEGVKRWLMTRSNAISYFRLAQNRSNSKTNLVFFKTWTLISIYIHACFSSVDQHSINIPTRLKNRSFTFPSWSFSVKVNTVYTFISFELQQCMNGRIIVAFIPMVNYPTNEMALTKIDYRSLESKRFLKWYCTNDASNRHIGIRNIIYFELFQCEYSFLFLFIVKKKKEILNRCLN